MSVDPQRLAEHVHGHLGWLAAALLVHPAVALRREGRRAHVAVALSTGVVTTVALLGAWLYVGYRAELKREIFVHAPAIGLLFERKEHLAFASVMLSWAGAAAYFAARSRRSGSAPTPAVRRPLDRIARVAFAGAAALAILVALLGTYVAAYRTF